MSFPNGAKKVKRIFIADELRRGIRSFCLLADDEMVATMYRLAAEPSQKTRSVVGLRKDGRYKRPGRRLGTIRRGSRMFGRGSGDAAFSGAIRRGKCSGEVTRVAGAPGGGWRNGGNEKQIGLPGLTRMVSESRSGSWSVIFWRSAVLGDFAVVRDQCAFCRSVARRM